LRTGGGNLGIRGADSGNDWLNLIEGRHTMVGQYIYILLQTVNNLFYLPNMALLHPNLRLHKIYSRIEIEKNEEVVLLHVEIALVLYRR